MMLPWIGLFIATVVAVAPSGETAINITRYAVAGAITVASLISGAIMNSRANNSDDNGNKEKR